MVKKKINKHVVSNVQIVAGKEPQLTANDKWEAMDVQRHNLPEDLIVPIAAANLESIETHVGTITHVFKGRKLPVNAVVVEAHRPARDPDLSLWNLKEGDQYYECLHPDRQLWVHVDFNAYRKAWINYDISEISSSIVLDHIHNREAVRISGYRHPFLRLCPISRITNTNSGLDNGAEGIEKDMLRNLDQQQVIHQQETKKRLAAPIVLADPFDLTKMLDIPPGLTELRGTAAMLKYFYN